jgi:hypothetical protein
MGLLMLLGGQSVIQFWVDPVSGSNSNNGSQSAPFATIYHATYQSLVGKWTANTNLVVNVVPSGPLQSTDHIRLVPQHNNGSILVRSATASPFVVNDACDRFITGLDNAKATLRVENCDVTCNRVVFLFTSTGSYNITLAGNCTFTHARVFNEEGIRINAPASGTLRIQSGCTITGWNLWANLVVGSITNIDIDGAVISSTAAIGGTTVLSGASVKLQNSQITIDNNTVVNQLRIIASNSTSPIEIRNNTITYTNSSGYAMFIYSPSPGTSTTASLVMSGNTTSGWIGVGQEITEASTRAVNNAKGINFTSIAITDNDMTQPVLSAGVFSLFANTDGAVVTDNYFRVAQLGDTTNVHQVYLWGDGIQFENNLCQASVLAFGPNPNIEGNTIVADRCILLGGTQGGSTASGGGNNYTVRDNVLISFDDDCYSDYAFNGAYPTNLGTLVADIDANYYVTLSGAAGLARLTAAGLTATTMTQLRNLWQQSVLSGSGSGVWGDASNSDNDSASSHVTAGAGYDSAVSLCVQSAELSRSQLASLDTALRA